jgi:hypothetical protein
MSLTQVVQIAQIVSALGTLGALGCTIYLANKARQEVREDRRLRTHPVVVFEPGGYVVPVSRRAFNHRIPGKDPARVEESFKDLPGSGSRIDSEPFARLRNIGQGPALEVEVLFVVELLEVNGVKKEIDEGFRAAPRYSRAWNTEVAMDHVLPAGAETQVSGLPCFVTLDFNDEISYAEGTITIAYQDMRARQLSTRQRFRYFNEGPKAHHRYLVNFGEIITIPT